MKIHIFIAHMGLGGSERVCVNLANEWAKRDHEVHISVLNLDNDVNTHLLDKKVSIHELGVSRLRYAAFPMLRYLKKYKPEFILVFGNEMAVIINKLKKLKLIDVKVIVRVLNNVNISLDKEDNVSPVVEQYLKSAQKQLADMECVVAQCKDMGEMLVKKGLIGRDKLKVIYNPVSEALLNDVEKIKNDGAYPDGNAVADRSAETSGKRITYIGRVDPQKQPLQLIEAFDIIAGQIPEARLRIVGDGNLMDRTKELVDKKKLTDKVIFDGIRKDMDRVYADTDVVILSSAYEGMPNSLIEAIGCGIPVVSYDCPIGPAEIVEDGVNGFLVSLNDIDELAQKTVLALKTSWDSDIIKATCKKFDVKNIADSYEEIFRACITK